MKRVTIAAAALFAMTFADAASTVRGISADGRAVEAVQLTPNIVKVTNTPLDQSAPASQTVIEPAAADFVDSPLKIEIDPTGVLTITDAVNGVWMRDSGERRIESGDYTIELTTNGRGSFYGGGERGHSSNLRGNKLVNYNRQNYGYTGSDSRISQMNITMPLVLSSDGYALLFDDFAASTLELGDTIRYVTEAPVPVSYYYIGGVRTLADLTERLTSLTGRQPLPPLWSLGYINSKYGYKSPEETIAVVDSLKSMGYPLDGTVLDLYWFGKEQDMGFLDWDRSVWPDPAGMMDSLRARGVNLVTVSEPYILRNGTGIANYEILDADTMMVRTAEGTTHPVTIWVGEGGMFDVSNPKTRTWLKNRYRMLSDLGIGGWWGDLGEPEVHPETGVHANGLTARQYHNRYGNDWAAIISELYAERYPDRRLMTLMRGGTTGLQRHCVFPWSTDVSRSWGGLEPQVRIMINAGLSGLGYMSSDLGGFAVDEANPYIPDLYVRWLQAGLFSPVFRTHATRFAEPYHYPQYAEVLLGIARERYRWLPYNYTLAYENTTKGWPLVRPVDFAEDGNGALDRTYNDEYLWGNSVLVAPVLSEGDTSRPVFFPAGSRWIDANDTRRVYDGGTTASVPAPWSVIPHFIRAGSIIPTADYEMENTSDYRADRFAINYYPGPATAYSLFDDNRISPRSIADRQYRLVNFRASAGPDGADIAISSTGTYPGAPAQIVFDFRINCMAAPATVSVDGFPVDAVYDSAERVVSFSIPYVAGTETAVRIVYHK